MDIHKNQQHQLAMERYHWVAGDKSRLFSLSMLQYFGNLKKKKIRKTYRKKVSESLNMF